MSPRVGLFRHSEEVLVKAPQIVGVSWETKRRGNDRGRKGKKGKKKGGRRK